MRVVYIHNYTAIVRFIIILFFFFFFFIILLKTFAAGSVSSSSSSRILRVCHRIDVMYAHERASERACLPHCRVWWCWWRINRNLLFCVRRDDDALIQTIEQSVLLLLPSSPAVEHGRRRRREEEKITQVVLLLLLFPHLLPPRPTDFFSSFPFFFYFTLWNIIVLPFPSLPLPSAFFCVCMWASSFDSHIYDHPPPPLLPTLPLPPSSSQFKILFKKIQKNNKIHGWSAIRVILQQSFYEFAVLNSETALPISLNALSAACFCLCLSLARSLGSHHRPEIHWTVRRTVMITCCLQSPSMFIGRWRWDGRIIISHCRRRRYYGDSAALQRQQPHCFFYLGINKARTVTNLLTHWLDISPGSPFLLPQTLVFYWDLMQFIVVCVYCVSLPVSARSLQRTEHVTTIKSVQHQSRTIRYSTWNWGQEPLMVGRSAAQQLPLSLCTQTHTHPLSWVEFSLVVVTVESSGWVNGGGSGGGGAQYSLQLNEGTFFLGGILLLLLLLLCYFTLRRPSVPPPHVSNALAYPIIYVFQWIKEEMKFILFLVEL